MQLKTIEFPFTLLTPCFSGTALGKDAPQAEMRVPPIRGHIRSWHRILCGSENANRVWGSANGNNGSGSRVGLRVSGSPMSSGEKAAILPHKSGGNSGSRPSLPPSNSETPAYTLTLQRWVGCTHDDWNQAQAATKLWLLLGCLGLRSNRAAGSVWPNGDWVPDGEGSFKTMLASLGLSRVGVALIGLNANVSPAELRRTASDTVNDKSVFGGISPRAPSPTRFKVIQLGAAYCLLAIAPTTGAGVGTQSAKLQRAEQLLNGKPDARRWKALGAWTYLFP